MSALLFNSLLTVRFDIPCPIHPAHMMDTVSIDALINNPPSPSPSNPSHMTTIFSNWPGIPSILPNHIPHDLTPPLLACLADLSFFTPNQHDRAWKLLNTYYQCRVRENSRSRAGYVGLNVEDVQRAIDSARRMSVGHMLEVESINRQKRKYSMRDGIVGLSEEGKGNRKWSIQDEIAENKKQKLSSLSEEEEEDLTSLPPFSALFKYAPISSKFPSRELPSLPKRQLTIEIPPVVFASTSAMQAATHEANLARRELEAAGDNLSLARGRYADAQKKYGEAKRRAKRMRMAT
jgi:hypothetical protein